MTELEDLKIQVSRLQATLIVHQHLMAALLANAKDLKKIITIFDDLHLASRDSMYFDQFSDQEINDSEMAYNVLRDYLTKTETWLNSK
jgi:hypothetical protein